MHWELKIHFDRNRGSISKKGFVWLSKEKMGGGGVISWKGKGETVQPNLIRSNCFGEFEAVGCTEGCARER